MSCQRPAGYGILNSSRSRYRSVLSLYVQIVRKAVKNEGRLESWACPGPAPFEPQTLPDRGGDKSWCALEQSRPGSFWIAVSCSGASVRGPVPGSCSGLGIQAGSLRPRESLGGERHSAM